MSLQNRRQLWRWITNGHSDAREWLVDLLTVLCSAEARFFRTSGSLSQIGVAVAEHLSVRNRCSSLWNAFEKLSDERLIEAAVQISREVSKCQC